MTKAYIAEYPGLAQTGSGDALIGAFAMPPTAEQVINSTATTGIIASLGAITAGTLYTAGTYNNVPLTGGTGSGATANITVAAGGVTVVTLVKRGTGYTVADALSAAAANIGGTGSGFSIPVSTIAQNSAPFQSSTQFVEISTDGICSVAFAAPGAVPIATTNNLRLAATERKIFRVVTLTDPANSPQGVITQQVSVITNT